MNMEYSFEILAGNIEHIQELTSNQAKNAVNQLLTIRNWIIGYYIVEFEQHGEDKAEYGTNLLESLEERINKVGMNRILFSLCRMFYLRYPQICSTVSNKFKSLANNEMIFLSNEIESDIKKSLNFEGKKICSTVSNKYITDPEILISKLSFSHIREIMPFEDPFIRFFYETECIKCGWSVRELRRQIATNLYLRAGISKKPELLLSQNAPALSIKEPFTFEFLGLEAKDAVSESDLEEALIRHLQEFLLELGKGFCFEARQKRIVIDDRYYFPDLVFYNRLLHCNVIIELKNDEFKHEYLGQLNAYVAYYKENEMEAGDNPPVGILLCTKKGPKMVEYALSGMDNHLFVSTYMLQLPDKTQLEEFLQRQMREMGL